MCESDQDIIIEFGWCFLNLDLLVEQLDYELGLVC